jgi:hypothetical protein
MTEATQTVPVTAEDLRAGDIIQWPDGRYQSVDRLPEPIDAEEYLAPKISVWLTDLDQDMKPAGPSTREAFSQNAVLQVLTPRPSE